MSSYSCTKSKSLQDLQAKLRDAFEKEKVDIEFVKTLLEGYESNREDWKQYVTLDPHHYTRNLVDRGNGAYNLIVLCWNDSQGSGIHNHSSSNCFVKILSGKLRETQFEYPVSETALKKTSLQDYGTNEVTFINDDIGVHRMENPSHSEPCISLHLYYPPFMSCSVYDEVHGKETPATMVFHTEYGQKAQKSCCEECPRPH
ncbi:hypothetical protein CAPTEDRAFT_221618 [Capitella teleta]|uniref:Cysteine dioxygenase n=1 Tax=Capitella teleta TaxID=283909 RepID=R7V6V3_CAPTE|nr:hypothetical protein CAPTEDRAFT_221618 [Capitella teleta]|eukprot:ELU11505.1 hypothetical protein CAPTEDRAFT_221618 [Capitella teleta]